MVVTPAGAPARKSRTAVSVDDQASGGVIAPFPGIEVRGRDVHVHVQLWAIEGTADAWWLCHFTPRFRRQTLHRCLIAARKTDGTPLCVPDICYLIDFSYSGSTVLALRRRLG
jgi:hypothetical protein